MINTTVTKVWVLRLGDTLLGVEPKAFKEVLEVGQPTPVPLAPALLLGLLSNQGHIVPVFDLCAALQLAPAGSGVAALLEVESRPLAFVIDEVVGLRTNLGGAWIAASENPLFAATVEDRGQTIQILDLARLSEHLSAQMSAPSQTASPLGRTAPQA